MSSLLDNINIVDENNCLFYEWELGFELVYERVIKSGLDYLEILKEKKGRAIVQ